jgi:hypothetical protein
MESDASTTDVPSAAPTIEGHGLEGQPDASTDAGTDTSVDATKVRESGDRSTAAGTSTRPPAPAVAE